MRVHTGSFRWIGVLGMMWVLAGCQAEAVKFVVKDQRDPEQVGLRIEWIRDFGQDGILATQPSNFGQSYVERGELLLRLFRITNISEENREIYPSVAGPAGTAVVLRQQYWNPGLPRSAYDTSGLLTPPWPTVAELTSEYRSEFEIIDADFDFGGGVAEAFPKTEGGNPKSVSIRAGESAILRLHLRLRDGFPLVMSEPLVGNQVVGRSFLPPGLNVSPQGLQLRVESILGILLTENAQADILIRNPLNDELNPVYLGSPRGPMAFSTECAKNIGVVFPVPGVAHYLDGLAVQR